MTNKNIHWTQRFTKLSCEGQHVRHYRGVCIGTGEVNLAIAPIANGEWAQHPYGNASLRPFHLVLGPDFIIEDTAGNKWHLQEENDLGPICHSCWVIQTAPDGTIQRHVLDGHVCDQCDECSSGTTCPWHREHGTCYAHPKPTPTS